MRNKRDIRKWASTYDAVYASLFDDADGGICPDVDRLITELEKIGWTYHPRDEDE